MAVTFQTDGGVNTITFDNPPANSYDLSVMREFSAAVDEAIRSEARCVIVRSASAKFFSAGADVRKFLDGDVDSNTEILRARQALSSGWRPPSRSSSRTSTATRSAGAWRSRLRATCGWRTPAATSWALRK